jgi:hypothetical protein
MRLLIPAAALVLAGCATTTPETLEQRIWRASNMELCEAVFFAPPNVAGPADHEARNRGVNCADHQHAVFTLRAQKEANRAAAAQILLSRPPVTYQPYQVPVPTIQRPRQTSCTSRNVGGTVYTDCQ